MLKIAYVYTGAITADEFQSLLPYVSEERRLFLNSCKPRMNKTNSLAGEVLARRMLAKELGLSPEVLSIQRSEKGKPYLEDAQGLYYNISHSGDYVICAISDSEIGIDIQKTLTLKTSLEKNILSTSEFEEAKGLEGLKREEYLTKIWCRKESYYKYLGSGIDRRPCETDSLLLEKEGRIKWLEGELLPGLSFALCQEADKADYPDVKINIENLITPE